MTAAGLVVHLVWAPLGAAPVERFVASYRRSDAGAPHRLLVAYNGFDDGASLGAARAAFDDVEHEELVVERSLQDVAVYARVAATADAPWLLFLNSHSELLDDGWAAKPLAHLRLPTVGLVGATGSFEAAPAPLLARLLRRRSAAPFPNPHIRTNAFMLEGELARALDWGDPRSKHGAWAVENGPRSLTRQVRAHGLETLVVGRDGAGYPPETWEKAAVFRSGEQRNLLVADNRTRQFDEADPAMRATLARLAWRG